MLSFDCHLESDRPTNRSARQIQRWKNLLAEHFDPGGRVSKRRSGDLVEEPVCPVREECADGRTAKSSAAMSVTSATHEIASLLNQCNHVFNRQDGPNFIGRED